MSGTTGSDPRVEWQVAPTGGIAILKLKSAGHASSWSLVRSVVSGGANVQQVTLFDSPGSAVPVFVDIGDGTKAPLDPTLTYQYVFTTSKGAVTTDPIVPSASIVLEQDQLTQILLRALASGVRSLVLPANFRNAPSVFHSMPMGAQPTIPMITLNGTLLQQGDIPIGQNNPNNVTTNTLIIGGQALRHYTIAVLTTTVDEREYYRDAVLAIFHSILGTILAAIGENASHRFQVHSSQVTGDGMQPGFYYAEILLELTGSFAVGVSTTYGVIREIVVQDEQGELFADIT
jgi:hypothetical protein